MLRIFRKLFESLLLPVIYKVGTHVIFPTNDCRRLYLHWNGEMVEMFFPDVLFLLRNSVLLNGGGVAMWKFLYCSS